MSDKLKEIYEMDVPQIENINRYKSWKRIKKKFWSWNVKNFSKIKNSLDIFSLVKQK